MKQRNVCFEGYECISKNEKNYIVFDTDINTNEIPDFATAEKIIRSGLLEAEYHDEVRFGEIVRIFRSTQLPQGEDADMRLKMVQSRWNFEVEVLTEAFNDTHIYFETDCVYEVTLEDYLECSHKLEEVSSELLGEQFSNEEFMKIMKKIGHEYVCSHCSLGCSFQETGNCILGIPFC